MTETTRRVSVTLTFATDDDPAEVAYSVHAAVRDESRFAVESATVHAFDLDEPDEDEQTVCLILTSHGIRWADAEGAETIGKRAGAVVVEVPVTADYRKDPQ